MEERSKYSKYVEGLVILTRHLRMVLVLLTKMLQILTPSKFLDKGEILTPEAFGEHEMILHVLTQAPTS